MLDLKDGALSEEDLARERLEAHVQVILEEAQADIDGGIFRHLRDAQATAHANPEMRK